MPISTYLDGSAFCFIGYYACCVCYYQMTCDTTGFSPLCGGASPGSPSLLVALPEVVAEPPRDGHPGQLLSPPPPGLHTGHPGRPILLLWHCYTRVSWWGTGEGRQTGCSPLFLVLLASGLGCHHCYDPQYQISCHVSCYYGSISSKLFNHPRIYSF